MGLHTVLQVAALHRLAKPGTGCPSGETRPLGRFRSHPSLGVQKAEKKPGRPSRVPQNKITLQAPAHFTRPKN